MRDIKREQKEELHITFLTELEINKNNVTLKTILIHIEYNGQMPHQNLNQLLNIFIEMFTIHIIFCPIAMALFQTHHLLKIIKAVWEQIWISSIQKMRCI